MLRILIAGIIPVVMLASACETEQPPPRDEPVMPDEQQMPAEVEVTDDELESFVRVNVIGQRDQLDPQADMEAFENLLEEHGLDVRQFEEISMAIQMDPTLQEEFQRLYEEIMQEEM